jgi:hypothetical protein
VTTWKPQPGSAVANVPDPRLNKLLVRYPHRYATLSEYATAAGMTIDAVVNHLSPLLDAGSLGLETCGGDIFVLTAPGGRPLPAHVPDVAPNLWETLRAGSSVPDAWSLWDTTRTLERAGWDVEADPDAVAGTLGRVTSPPRIGVRIATTIVPVLTAGPHARLAEPTGLLGEYERAGAAAVAVVCDGGTLDATTTAVRRWVLSRQAMPTHLSVIILEKPGVAPVILSAADSAVAPVTVDRPTLATLDWAN